MPKVVLVATDASPASRNAAEQAVRLAASLRARLAAVAVVPGFEGGMHLEFMDAKMEAVDAPFQTILRDVETMARAAGVEIESVLEHGRPHEAIVDEAEAFDAAYIVLGVKPRSLLARTLLEPTAARVIGYTRRPVLVVPEGCSLDLGTILLATDGSRHSARAEEKALELAASYGSRLDVLSAVDVPAEYHIWEHVVEDFAAVAARLLEKVCARAEARGLTVKPLLIRDNPADAILGVAKDDAATLIVMGTHGHTGLRRLLLGGVAEAVLSQAPCPVLVVPAA